jgi:hypothetical protein
VASIMRTAGFVIALATVLALAPTNVWSSGKPITGFPSSQLLVGYSESGGIRFEYKALLVSVDGKVAATSGKCLARFHLRDPPWKSLKATLRKTNMHYLAGEYPPPSGSADGFEYDIYARGYRVRTADGSIPSGLEPLLKRLREVLSIGERQMSQSCSDKGAM